MTWLAVTVVLLVILVSNQLARVLSQAAANNFPREIVFALIALTSAGYLSVIVPIGFFLAIMLALGRLYHESEMAAIQSCGVGPAGLFRPIGLLGAVIAALLIWLSFWAIPEATARAQEIRTAALREAQFGLLEPGKFRTFGGGNVVFYAERVDESGMLHNVNVFVDRAAIERNAAQSRTTNGAGKSTGNGASNGVPGARKTVENKTERLEVWVAARAQQRGAGQEEQTFVLYDGERYEGAPGTGEFRIIEFAEGGIPIRLGELASRTRSPEMKTTAELLRSADPADRAELQWRISTPLLAFVLMLLAVPLSRLRPRQGRFGRIGIAILVYFLYSQLLAAARTWVEADVVPRFAGLWWVHAIALCLALWLIARESPPARPRLVARHP